MRRGRSRRLGLVALVLVIAPRLVDFDVTVVGRSGIGAAKAVPPSRRPEALKTAAGMSSFLGVYIPRATADLMAESILAPERANPATGRRKVRSDAKIRVPENRCRSRRARPGKCARRNGVRKTGRTMPAAAIRAMVGVVNFHASPRTPAPSSLGGCDARTVPPPPLDPSPGLSRRPTVMTESTLDRRPDASEVCACQHLKQEHDAVASRFCDATLAAGLRRECVCAVKSGPRVRSYDRR